MSDLGKESKAFTYLNSSTISLR